MGAVKFLEKKSVITALALLCTFLLDPLLSPPEETHLSSIYFELMHIYYVFTVVFEVRELSRVS